jgi:hypothetical protein
MGLLAVRRLRPWLRLGLIADDVLMERHWPALVR